MSLYIFCIIIFSSLSIVFTEMYLRAIEYANKKSQKSKQDKIKIVVYPIFLLLILAMSVIPDYLPNFEHKVGILTFLPFFNVGSYLVANWSRSLSVLHTN